MQASLVRLDWLKLYKALQRAGREFPQYSYRHFTRRRVRDYFEKYRTQTLGEERLGELYEEGQKALTSIRRQAKISALFPHRPSVIEQKGSSG